MLVTAKMIKELCPDANVFWAERIAFYFNEYAAVYEINTPQRTQHFFAQAAHETGCFTRFVENLNYSAARLQVVFPALFPTPTIAKQYGGNPEKIANRAYANKGGNGNEASGDGWEHRGRGIFQLTLRNNYERFSLHFYHDAKKLRPDDVATPILAVASAMWYWQSNGLNQLADQNAIEMITAKINKAKLGLDERKRYYARAKLIFK